MSQNIAPIDKEIEDPRIAELFGRFEKDGVSVPMLYRILANAPEMLCGWTQFARVLRHDAVSDRGLRELVILRTALLQTSLFEWAAHYPVALANGETQERLTSLGDWRASDCFSPAQRAVLLCTDEISLEGGASRDSMAALSEHFGRDQCVELILTASFYGCVAAVLASFGIAEIDDDSEAVTQFRRQVRLLKV